MSFTTQQLQKLLSETETVLRDCGRFIRSAHDIESELFVKPGDKNFVTAYDVEVQKRLQKALSALLPEAAFIGEESDSNTMDAPLAFIVDPIDGTTNFICGFQHSCISVGLRENGQMIAGAVYNPYLNEFFSACRGGGASVNGRPLRLSDVPLSDSVVGFGTTPYDHTKSHDTFVLAETIFLRSRGVRRSGSAALDICYVAAGRMSGFFEIRLQPWDYAAASCIVAEAGGLVTQMDGSPITLNRPCSILAGNPAAHAELLPLCTPYQLKEA